MAEAFKVRPHVRRVVNVVQSDRRHQVTLHDMRSWKVGESLYNCFFSECVFCSCRYLNYFKKKRTHLTVFVRYLCRKFYSAAYVRLILLIFVPVVLFLFPTSRSSPTLLLCATLYPENPSKSLCQDTMPLFHDTLWRVTAIDIEYTLAKVMQRVVNSAVSRQSSMSACRTACFCKELVILCHTLSLYGTFSFG